MAPWHSPLVQVASYCSWNLGTEEVQSQKCFRYLLVHNPVLCIKQSKLLSIKFLINHNLSQLVTFAKQWNQLAPGNERVNTVIIRDSIMNIVQWKFGCPEMKIETTFRPAIYANMVAHDEQIATLFYL